jgi:hypothetical protein
MLSWHARSTSLIAILLSAAVAMTPAIATASLVLFIPTQNGLLAAADSRTVVLGTICDNMPKLREPTRRERTIVATVGEGQFSLIDPSIPNRCEEFHAAPRVFDPEALAAGNLDQRTGRLTHDEFTQLQAALLAGARSFARSTPPIVAHFKNRSWFSVIVGSYSVSDRLATIGAFEITVLHGGPALGRIDWLEFSPTSKRDIYWAGEVEYAKHFVLRNPKAGLESFRNFMTAGRLVQDTEVSEARTAAVTLIHAVTEATRIAPARTPVGGPVDLLWVGSGATRPLRLQWKRSNDVR